MKLTIDRASSDELKELHRGTVSMFQMKFKLRDEIENLWLLDKDRDVIEKKLGEIDKTLVERFH